MTPQGRAPKEAIRMVKTTLELPEPLWRAAKLRAMDERTNFKQVVVSTLAAYLKTAVKDKR